MTSVLSYRLCWVFIPGQMNLHNTSSDRFAQNFHPESDWQWYCTYSVPVKLTLLPEIPVYRLNFFFSWNLKFKWLCIYKTSHLDGLSKYNSCYGKIFYSIQLKLLDYNYSQSIRWQLCVKNITLKLLYLNSKMCNKIKALLGNMLLPLGLVTKCYRPQFCIWLI